MASEIQLTRGYVAVVDDDDFENVNQYYWFYKADAGTAYAIGNLSRKPDNYVEHRNRKRRPNGTGNVGKTIPMHRFILDAPDDMEVDHINGNGLDNRRSNLRLVDRSNNLKNRRVFKNSRLGLKGIRLDKKTGRYCVSIRVSFDTLEKAIQERERIYQLVHGIYYGTETQSIDPVEQSGG